MTWKKRATSVIHYMSLYDVLEVVPDASHEDIKRSYKKLALRLHPDKTGGDEDAAESFRKVNAAYAVLGDAERRTKYDRFGVTAANDQPADGAGFEDVIRGMFGGAGLGQGLHGFSFIPHAHHFQFQQQQQQQQQHMDTFDISLEPRDVYLGCTKRVEFTATDACPTCRGSGAAFPEDLISCLSCDGTGFLNIPIPGFPIRPHCPACSGQGRAFRTNRRCSVCAGACTVVKKRSFDVRLPPGTPDGMRQVLAGKGSFDPKSRMPKDVELHFRRTLPELCTVDSQGGGVTITVPLDLEEVLCGFTRKVDVFGGADSVDVSAYAYEWPGRVVEFPGKGLPTSFGGDEGAVARGTLKVVFDVKFPKDEENLAKYRDVLCRMFAKQKAGGRCPPVTCPGAPREGT
jgi:DnaJ-class molecular chaperone